MTWLSRLFRREKQDTQLDSELRFHVEQQIADLIAEGVAPAEARRRALAQFGGVEHIKEDCREARGTHFIDTLLQDIRFAFRILRKTPLVTSIAIISLALGIGANTAIFSLIDAVMLRMLPVQDPEQLVEILFRSPTASRLRPNVTNPIWEQVRDHQDAFASVFAWRSTDFDLADGGQENTIPGVYASGDYFTSLGVRPAAGRLLTASDDVRGCSGAAVLGYGYWQSHYAGAESAIGSFIQLNGYSFPIVGVAQRGFSGIDIGTSLGVAIPICAEAILDGKDSSLDVRDDWWLGMMGRLKPGTSVEQVGAHMKVLSQPLFGAVVPQDWPSKSQDIFRKYTFAVLPAATGAGGPFALRAHYRQPLEILMFVVGLVLLIACANIASLLLARSAARQKEIAVRLSLGASRGRLIRQVLTESVVLSGAGALRRSLRRRCAPRCFLRALGECAVSAFRFHAGEPGIFGCPDGRPRLSFHNRHRRIMRPTFRHSPCVALDARLRHVCNERGPVARRGRPLSVRCGALDRCRASCLLADSAHRYRPLHSHIHQLGDARRWIRPQ
ncbi:MAG: ABC transporter permease [Candidatus Acidiferrales bacterium]